MIEIALKDLKKDYGADTVLKNIRFEVKTGERVGLIGDNGCGKTTIFKVICGIENYTSGMVTIRKESVVGYLNQIPKYPSKYTVKDVLNSAFKNIFEIRDKMKKLESKMASLENDNLDSTMNRYAHLQHEFEINGGYDIDEKMSKICSGLKFSEEFLNKKFTLLSGGEKTTTILGKILLENPDILLLDEPTNHLDIESIEWLEEYLSNYDGTVLVISHDRYFLDKVVNRLIEIENGESNFYHGNYSYYIKEKEKRNIRQLEEYKQQQKKIKSMKESIKRFKEWGNRADDGKFFKKAANMEKRIERMQKIDKPNLHKKKISLSFNESKRSGNDVIVVSNLCKSFNNKEIIKDAHLFLEYLDKTALLGKNGCGKSTLFKIILNEYLDKNKITCEEIKKYEKHLSQYMKDKGTINIGSSVKIAYLDQNITFNDEQNSVLKEFRENIIMSEEEARNILAGFLFYGDDVFKKVKNLSGGERSRLKLCQLMHMDINLLILDEPTNHLDINSREMLEKALLGFNGTILFISHDRYFVNKIANIVVEMRDKKLVKYNGNYNYYVNEREKEKIKIDKQKSKNINSNKKNSKNKKSNKRQSKKKIKQKKEYEKRIYTLEEKIEDIDDRMQENASNHNKLEELYNEKVELQNELDIVLEKWIDIEQEVK